MIRMATGTALHRVILTACHAWHPVTISPREFVEAQGAAEVRVITSDGTRLELHDLRIVGDSIVGEARGRETPPAGKAGPSREASSVSNVVTFRIALDDIVAVEERRHGDLPGPVTTVLVVAFIPTISTSS